MSFFKHVDTILQKYHETHDMTNVPISVDKLRPIFQELGYIDRIIWEEVDFESKFILAQIKTYKQSMGVYAGVGDYARIQITSGLNYCWKRFIICKEMYHCILDEPQENRVRSFKDLYKLSDYFTNSFLNVIADEMEEEEDFPPFETEEIAEIMAIETLFPIELRRTYCDDFDSGKITARQLSLRYRIPIEYIYTSMIDSYFSAVSRGRNMIDINADIES